MYIYLSFCKPARVYVSEQVHYDSKTHADKAARQYVSIYPRKGLLCLYCVMCKVSSRNFWLQKKTT